MLEGERSFHSPCQCCENANAYDGAYCDAWEGRVERVHCHSGERAWSSPGGIGSLYFEGIKGCYEVVCVEGKREGCLNCCACVE